MYDQSIEDFLNYYYINEIKQSSKKEDMFDHIDLYYNNISFDVKGKKAIRKNESIQEDYTWIEVLNVRGDPGWVCGKADYIAFNYENGYLFCDRYDLYNYSKKLFPNADSIVQIPPKHIPLETQCLYRRYNRRDAVYLVKFSDILDMGIYDNTGNLENINFYK